MAMTRTSSSGLWTKDDAKPPWFKSDLFLAPEFDAETAIRDMRRFVPLEALGQELEAQLGRLKAKLFEVINQDYNDFVDLSTKLVNVEAAVLQFQAPLEEVQNSVGNVAASVEAELSTLSEGLKRRQLIAASRALLELMQDTAHVMNKVEKLLGEVGQLPQEVATSPVSNEALDERCRMLERLASEVSRLHYNAARAQGLPFIQQLQPRMSAAASKLGVLLAQALQAVLAREAPSARQHCLHAYAAVGDFAGAEQVVRQALVRPAVQSVLAAAEAARPPGGVSGAEELGPLLQGLLQACRASCRQLLEATLAPHSGLTGYELLGNAILAEVDEALAEGLPGVFSAGVPAAFQANYLSAVQFLEGLEALCPTQEAVTAFRSSAAHQTFTGRWKLSFYFTLCFQDIVRGVEGAVSEGVPQAAGHAPEDRNVLSLQLGPTLALFQGLNRVLDKGTFLQPLADRFVRLALQLLARYASWLSAGLEQAPSRAPQAPDDGLQQSEGLEQAAPGPWGAQAPTELLASARADVDEISEWVAVDYSRAVSQMLAFLPDQAVQAVEDALAAGTRAIEDLGQPLVERMVGQLSGRCSEALQQLRGISMTYRMTTKPLPTRASPYAGALLGPLRSFQEGSPAQAMRRSAQLLVAEGVFTSVAEAFSTMAAQLLDTLQRTETSLKKLNRARKTEGDGSQLSDLDKILAQLVLDVQELGRSAGKLGLDAPANTAFKHLWETVTQNNPRALEL